MVYKIRLKKDDNVIILSGKYKGKTGKITATHPSENKVTVEGVNIIKRHRKATQANPKAGIFEITKPIWVSKVALIDPTSKKPSKIAYKFDTKGNKIRVYKKSGKAVK